MGKILRWIGMALFALVSLFLIWFGITYASVQDMLWFHAAAVPEAARDEVRPLYFALMSLIGAASAALGVLSVYVVAVPLRHGARWAASALVAVNAIVFVMAAITAESLARLTGAPTSWRIMGVLLAISLVAFLASWAGANAPSRGAAAQTGAM